MEPAAVPQHYLARRGNWQLVAQQGGAKAEHDTEHVIRAHLDEKYPGQFTVVRHPDDLKWLYFDIHASSIRPCTLDRLSQLKRMFGGMALRAGT